MIFLTGGSFAGFASQGWNANGDVTDCGTPGFGFNSGNFAQDICLNGAYVEASSIAPDTLLLATLDHATPRLPQHSGHKPGKIPLNWRNRIKIIDDESVMPQIRTNRIRPHSLAFRDALGRARGQALSLSSCFQPQVTQISESCANQSLTLAGQMLQIW